MRTREFLDSLELAREFADRVDTRRRVDAGVRGASVDRNLELPGAFAFRLQGAPHRCRFQHQHGLRFLGFRHDPLAEGDARSLLVRVEEEADGAGRRDSQSLERAERPQATHNPGLHIQDARPVSPVAANLEWHARKRPQVPYSIQMTEEQNGLYATP